MQITTQTKPRHILAAEAPDGERAIVFSAARLDDPATATDYRLNGVDAWALIQDLGAQTHYQSSPNKLASADDWDLHQDWTTRILYFNLVGSNGRRLHVRLTAREAWNLSVKLEEIYNEAFLPERWRGGVTA